MTPKSSLCLAAFLFLFFTTGCNQVAKLGGDPKKNSGDTGNLTVLEAHSNFAVVSSDCKDCPADDMTATDGTRILDIAESDDDEETEVVLSADKKIKVKRKVGCRIRPDLSFGVKGQVDVVVPEVQNDPGQGFTVLMHPNLLEGADGSVYFGAWPLFWNGRAYGGDAGSFLYVFKWNGNGTTASAFADNGVKKIDYYDTGVAKRIYGNALSEAGTNDFLVGGAVLKTSTGYAGDNSVVVRLRRDNGAFENFSGTSSPLDIGPTANFHTQSLTKLADGRIAEYRFSWGGIGEICYRDATTYAVISCITGELRRTSPYTEYPNLFGAAWQTASGFFAPLPFGIASFTGNPVQIIERPSALVPNPNTSDLVELGLTEMKLRQLTSPTTPDYYSEVAKGTLNPPYGGERAKKFAASAGTFVNHDSKKLVVASAWTNGFTGGHPSAPTAPEPRSAKSGAFLACLEPPSAVNGHYFDRGFSYYFLDVGAQQFMGGYYNTVAMIPSGSPNKFYVAFQGTQNPKASYFIRRYEVKYFTPR